MSAKFWDRGTITRAKSWLQESRTLGEALSSMRRAWPSMTEASLYNGFKRAGEPPPSTFLKTARRPNSSVPLQKIVSAPTSDPFEAARSQRAQLASDSRDRQALKASLGHLEALEAQISTLTAPYAAPAKPVNRPRISGNRHPATLVVSLSDVHAGATVELSPVSYGNHYNQAVCESRITKYFAGVEWKVQAYRSGDHGKAYDLHHVKLWCGGDMIDGQLHDDQKEMSHTPIEAIRWFEPLLVDGIKRLLALGVDVSVVCSFGNHGRDTKKMQFGKGAEHNHEWGMYCRLGRQLPGVEVSATKDEFQFFDIYGRTFCGHHGHRIAYQGGVGGIWIPANKAIDKWQMGVPCYHYLFGHYHTLEFGSRGTFNGSVIGYSPMARGFKCAPERPQQAALLVDEEHGVVDTTRIWVEDREAEASL
jgi:hypothetical protein